MNVGNKIFIVYLAIWKQKKIVYTFQITGLDWSFNIW